jgi:hypothetical protein
MAKSNVWTVEEDILLKKLWGIHSVDEIASIMKRHRLTILKKAKELGLRKSRSAKWSEEEIQFIIKHYPVKRVDWCSEKLWQPVHESLESQVE